MKKRTSLVLPIAIAAGTVLLAPGAQAAFPGANGRIVFGSAGGDLLLVNAHTGRVRHLTSTARAREGMPDWSADGSKVAFSRCRGSEFGNCDIWVIDGDGSNATRLTHTKNAQETWPAWSPDGTQIAFTTNIADPFQDVYVMDADGNNPAPLVAHANVFDAFPEWSPDGAQIAYTSDVMAVDDIWVVDANGSNETRLTQGPRVDERPDWSPDGTTIVFSRNGRDIWRVDAAGGNLTQLTDNNRQEFAPAYSPDGTMIALNRQSRHHRFGVWLMNADGSSPQRLTRGLFDFFPDWQPA